MNSEMLWLIIPIGVPVILIVLVAVMITKKRSQLKRYDRLSLGMSEEEMLKIMGKGYNRSLLKDNRKKYEWRINATSSSAGSSTRFYSGVKKVDVYTKDGFIEEIRPYNV